MRQRMNPLTLFVACVLVLNLCACSSSGTAGDGGSAEPELTWQDYYDLGVRYLSEGNYQEAIIAFTAAIEIDPKLAPAYVGRGDAYVLSGETEENLTAAQADYKIAIELDEALAEAYLGLADVYVRRGDYEKALEILREGLERVADSREIEDKIEEIEEENMLDASKALAIANELVARYHSYEYIGVACDLTDDFSAEVYEEIYRELLSEDQKGYFGTLLKSTCCKTFNEVKLQVKQYIDSSLISRISDDYVVYHSDLYFVVGAMGIPGYENVSLDEFNQEKIIASAGIYVGIDTRIGTCQFTIEKRGRDYIVTDVVKYEENAGSAEEAPVTILLEWDNQGMNLGFTVSAQLDSGGEAVWRDQTLYDQNGEVLASIEAGAWERKLTILNHNAKYSVMVEDVDWSPESLTMNTISGAGARITIQKGTTTVVNEELALYRAPTGYWFGGVCEVDHGIVKEYAFY